MKKLFCKIKTKLSDGSMDSYNLKGIFYCLIPFMLLLILLIELVIVSLLIALHIGKIQIYIEPLILLCFFLFSCYINYFIFKILKKNLLNKYIFFSLLLLIGLIISVLITLNWISSFMFSISNLLIVIWKIPDSLKFPYKNINILVDMISKSSLEMFTFCVTIWISYMLNFILPKSLQKKDIPIKERVKRGFIKFALLSFIIFLTIIFSVINKDNFSSVTIFTTLFTFICTPQMILRVFSNYKNIEKLEISEGVLRTFDYIKLLYYECLFSWSISIYIFQAQNTETKIEVFAISLFLLMFVTLISQKLIFKFNKQIFSNWIVSVDNKNKYKLIKEKQSRKYKITKKL